jgi:hypothetical protein
MEQLPSGNMRAERMSISFIYRQRLFAKPVRLAEPAFFYGFFFEALLAAAIWMLSLELDDLVPFASNQPAVIVSPNTFRLFGLIGIYGIRLAWFIAIIRQNRAPQILEWVVTLLGLGAAFFCFMFGAFLLDGYAGLHGYRRCPAIGFRAREAVFVRPQTPCPPIRDAAS